jgi:hypothetical protein
MRESNDCNKKYKKKLEFIKKNSLCYHVNFNNDFIGRLLKADKTWYFQPQVIDFDYHMMEDIGKFMHYELFKCKHCAYWVPGISCEDSEKDWLKCESTGIPPKFYKNKYNKELERS